MLLYSVATVACVIFVVTTASFSAVYSEYMHWYIKRAPPYIFGKSKFYFWVYEISKEKIKMEIV